MFKCSNFQIFKCSNFQMFKCSNFQMFKCSNLKYQMSNFNRVRLLSERTYRLPPVIFIQVSSHGLISLIMRTQTGTLNTLSQNHWICASLFQTKQQKKVSMKCSLPVAQVQKILFREGGSATDETWISESQQEKFLCQKIYDKNLIHLH